MSHLEQLPVPPCRLFESWLDIGRFLFIFRYESEGDMFVGRTVSGLPIDSAEFSILPHFEECNEQVEKTIKICFPTISEDLFKICEFCLASLVYHVDFFLKQSSHSFISIISIRIT